MMIIKAQNLKVGDQLAEQNGFLWDITKIIKETEKTITVKLLSSIQQHGTTGPGIIKTFRKSISLYGVKGAN